MSQINSNRTRTDQPPPSKSIVMQNINVPVERWFLLPPCPASTTTIVYTHQTIPHIQGRK
ncbi:hypothetical protein L249_7604 [Ophiocordyceps polyrhachis-furcata BCC 54312]|uniref:Uncharacterized protein n=1 Tax=Ophiocordyceps polyrhachis-furcata BCC 54312 TaxID=1330021 RepID=A0A367LAA1_9HYPO|nr:hypothetical protein L249_7604 [Ophiocordyceps polyrhachis-furcata BCC 54312]